MMNMKLHLIEPGRRTPTRFRRPGAAIAVLCLACVAGNVGADAGPVVNDDPTKPLALVLRRPWYRHTIFASMPVRTLRIEAYPSVHVNPALIVNSRLEVSVTDAHGTAFASTSVVNRRLTFLIRVELDLANLPPGDDRIVARLRDSTVGQRAATARRGWIELKLPPLDADAFSFELP